MLRTIRRLPHLLAVVLIGGLFLSVVPVSSAQVRRRVIIVQRFDPFFDPFFPWYAYPYPYPPNYMAANYGEVKIDPHHKFAEVYIDGGYAGTITKSKKFALKPGNHEIALKNSDGVTFYHKKVAVMIGQTTKLPVS
ncbi:MAG TPA: hypothetical protein VI431_04980 [Candidatus Acidoferrum sp.]